MADYLHENPKDHGVIRPVVYWRKKISVLTPFANGPVRFGGPLPQATIEGGEMIHSTLTFKTAGDSIFGGLGVESLPFVFPFRHDGGSIEYRITKAGGIVDLEVEPPEPDDEWPYPNYPGAFDETYYQCSDPRAIGREEEMRLLHQEPWFNHDRDAIVILPSSAADPSLPNHIWNYPDDEPSVQCLFILNTDSMKVSAFNDVD